MCSACDGTAAPMGNTNVSKWHKDDVKEAIAGSERGTLPANRNDT